MEIKKEQKRRKEKKISLLLEDLTSLESYVSDLFTFSPLPICFVSPTGVILEFNPAFEEISGFKSHETVGEPIEKIFDEKEIKELGKETLNKNFVKGKEIKLFSKKSKIVIVSAFTRTRKDEKGKKVGYFLGVFNITDVKKVEKELREKVEELEKFQRLAVGRELKMIELKKEIEKLKEKLENTKKSDK